MSDFTIWETVSAGCWMQLFKDYNVKSKGSDQSGVRGEEGNLLYSINSDGKPMELIKSAAETSWGFFNWVCSGYVERWGKIQYRWIAL